MSIIFDTETIKTTVYETLAPKIGTGVLNPAGELDNNKDAFRSTIESLSDYIYENYTKNSILSIDFIKGLHRLLYPKGTKIIVFRGGKYYHNLPGEWRLNEARAKEDNHLHSEQINIGNDLIHATHFYNSIETKKRTDILRYYFDFLRVHPFADSNLTIVSIICNLECKKYSFEPLNFLKIRFEDGKFNRYFLYYYENNKNKAGILDEVINLIDDFHNKGLSQEIIDEKEKIMVKTTQELFGGRASVFDMEDPYQKELSDIIENNFINISKELPDYKVRKIVYENTLPYLKNALLRAPKDNHQIIFNGYSGDMERIITYCQSNTVFSGDEKLNINFILGLHKNLFPVGYIQKARDINGKEFVQMVPGRYREIDLYSTTNTKKDIYAEWQEVGMGLRKIVATFNESKFQIHDILLFMSDFSRVHPFGDGNGRVIDILVDLLCIKNNLEPLYFGKRKENNKVGFYKILDEVYETRDSTPFYEFIQKYSE